MKFLYLLRRYLPEYRVETYQIFKELTEDSINFQERNKDEKSRRSVL